MLSEMLIKYGSQELNKPPYPKERHWPSDAGKCIRALVYRWRGEKPGRREGRIFFVFSDGNLHHDSTIKQLKEAGAEIVMQEAPIRDSEKNLSGKLDALIKIDGKHYVLEIKSISRYGFDEIMRDGPRDDHILQLQLYLHCVLNQDRFKVHTRQGIILYKNKDTSKFYDYIIDYNESYVQNFFTQLKTVEEYVAQNTLPERPYERTDWHCSYCDYERVCWQGLGIKPIPELTDEELVTLLGELIWTKQQRLEFENREDDLTKQVKDIFLQKKIERLKLEGKEAELTKQVKEILQQKKIERLKFKKKEGELIKQVEKILRQKKIEYESGRIGSYLVELKETVQRRLDKEKIEELAKSLGKNPNEFYKELISQRLTIKEV